jgi:hypothetical protein
MAVLPGAPEGAPARCCAASQLRQLHALYRYSATALTLAIQLQVSGTGYRWLVLHSGCNVASSARPLLRQLASQPAFAASPWLQVRWLWLAAALLDSRARYNWKTEVLVRG